MEQDLRRDLTRTVLAVLVIGGLIAASLWIVRPFIAATIWATMIVITTWPMLRALQSRLWGKRWLATTVMTVALLLLFVIPLSAAIGTIVSNSERSSTGRIRFSDVKLPPPPAFVEKIPVVGEKVANVWREYADKGSEELAEIVRPYASPRHELVRRRGRQLRSGEPAVPAHRRYLRDPLHERRRRRPLGAPIWPAPGRRARRSGRAPRRSGDPGRRARRRRHGRSCSRCSAESASRSPASRSRRCSRR